MFAPWRYVAYIPDVPGSLSKRSIEEAFEALDEILPAEVALIVGGGTAMILAYGIPIATTDVDAYPAGMSAAELDPYVKRVAREKGLAPDWLNTYYETYAFVLPPDYKSRLRDVFTGRRLRARSLGPEDLLVMKCFAGRDKDRSHARALLREKPDLAIVEGRLSALAEKGLKGAQNALDFFDDLLEEATR
jgi:predicted nucleotidyltransferase